MTVSVPALTLVGIVSGWIMGTSAAAWGALSVPLLILLGVEPLAAISSSLAASVILSLFGGLTHWRYDRSRLEPLTPLLLGGCAGAVLGSVVSPVLSPSTLGLFIGVTSLSAGLLALFRRKAVRSGDTPGEETVKWQNRRATLAGVGVVAGFFAGAFGAGWGTIGVALLVRTGIPPHAVVGSSLAARSLVSLTAVGSYAVQWHLAPPAVFVPLLLGGGAGVYFGVRMANGFSAKGMRIFLGVMITVVGALTMGKVLW